MNVVAVVVLLVATSCSHTVAAQKPRAWIGNASPSATCGYSDGYGSKWECDGPVTQPAPQRVYAVGETIDIGTEWSAYCRVKESDRLEAAWTVERCKDVPHEAILICDNPACRVGRDAERRSLTATLTAAGRYPIRVRFIDRDWVQREVVLPTIEAVAPDDVIVACSTAGLTRTVQVSVTRRGKVLPTSVSLALADGATCEPRYSVLPNASTYECTGTGRVEGKVTTPAIAKELSVDCQPR